MWIKKSNVSWLMGLCCDWLKGGVLIFSYYCLSRYLHSSWHVSDKVFCQGISAMVRCREESIYYSQRHKYKVVIINNLSWNSNLVLWFRVTVTSSCRKHHFCWLLNIYSKICLGVEYIPPVLETSVCWTQAFNYWFSKPIQTNARTPPPFTLLAKPHKYLDWCYGKYSLEILWF